MAYIKCYDTYDANDTLECSDEMYENTGLCIYRWSMEEHDKALLQQG